MYFATKNGEQQIKDILLPINAVHRHGFIGIFFISLYTNYKKRTYKQSVFMFFIGTVEKYNLCRTYKSSIPTRFIGTFEGF